VSIAWLFPGQGAQSVGMGKALCEAFPAAREIFERADKAL
jgi:[acyl-carrier-protein] S-malonyltransferase